MRIPGRRMGSEDKSVKEIETKEKNKRKKEGRRRLFRHRGRASEKTPGGVLGRGRLMMRVARNAAPPKTGCAKNEGRRIEKNKQRRCDLWQGTSSHRWEYMPDFAKKSILLPLEAHRHPISKRDDRGGQFRVGVEGFVEGLNPDGVGVVG